MASPQKDESAIDSIEHELYDPKAKMGSTEIHHVRAGRDLTLPTSWGEDSPVITKREEGHGVSFGVKMLLVSIVFLFVALAFTAWRVISLRNVVSSANIDMTADITPFVEGGEATPLLLTVNNRNLSTLEDVQVTLLYKQGSSSLDEQEKVQEKRQIGSIVSNEFKKQDFSVILYGAEGETRDITLKLEYKVPGSNAVFNKLLNTSVVLNAPPISVSVEGPDTLSVGQNGTFRFVVRNNSATSSLPSLLQLALPNTFTLIDSSEKPLPRTTSWNIASLAPGEATTITLTGSLQGKEGETATVQAKIGSQDGSSNSLGIVYASETQDIKLRASPISLTLRLVSNDGREDILTYSDKARFEIEYKNTSIQAIEDVSIVLSLEGDAPTYANINPTSGYYDSVAKTITWNKATFPDLAVLAPNSQGSLQVFIPVVDKGSNTPKLSAKLVASGSSKALNDIVATVSKSWAVQGSASITASTRYKNSVLTNSGPIPPKANVETSYSVSLNVSSQNALSAAKVSFTLPIYVSWRGETTDNERITYDARTKTVTWNIGEMKRGELATGEVSLLVKPSLSHLGQSPAITSGVVLDVLEADSRARLKMTLSPLTTKIVGESWAGNPSLVVE